MTPVIADGSVVKRDIPYVPGGASQQTLDLYAPKSAKEVPVVIFVHGGEWTKGDKSEVSYKPKFFNENGIVFVSVNYRLSGTAQHPAQVNDVAAAIRWLRDHVVKYGGDPRKLVLMGHSAGCHLVTFVGLDPAPLASVQMRPADLLAVVSWSGGAFDLVEKVKSGGMYADYIRKNFGSDRQSWHDASPIFHIGDSKPMPPFLFASAENGNPESRVASERMAMIIRLAGGQAETSRLSGRDHTTANHLIGAPGDKTGAILLQFIWKAVRAGS